MNALLTGEAAARAIPRPEGLDHSLAFLADPYRFISHHCRALGTDVMQVTLMLQPTICITGARAAELFYDRERLSRADAAPEGLASTLFGRQAVQGLDGDAHAQRRQFFLTALTPARVRGLVDEAERVWNDMAPVWQAEREVCLYTAAQQWLARTASNWAGVPLPDNDLVRRSRQLACLFGDTASGPFAHLQARRARKALEDWLTALIRAQRNRSQVFMPGTLAEGAAWLTDFNGAPLAPRTAAMELINLLRPTVAVAVYVVHLAHALHQYPGASLALVNCEGYEATENADAFVHEVRRFYPLFPAVVARVREGFTWQGFYFAKGRRVLLDLYGTNHDPRLWADPDSFQPQRFIRRTPGPFELIPQGGGDAIESHRCPGEGATLGLMRLALELLTARTRYSVPPQDLTLEMNRLPALPKSRFLLADFEATA